MSLIETRIRLRHIEEHISFVENFVYGKSYDDFCIDRRTVLAVVACFAIIGEAAKYVPPDIKSKYPAVPWGKMTRMRNVLVHAYDQIDLEVVWKTIHEHLPGLRRDVRSIIEDLGRDTQSG